MLSTFIPDDNICRQVSSLKLSPADTERELTRLGVDTGQIAAYQAAIKKLRYERRRTTGFLCMAAGALLGFISCVLSVAHAMPHMFDFILYGLTSIAVCIVLLGLYYVFE